MNEQMRLIKSSRQGENIHSGMIGEVGNYMFHFEKESKSGEQLYWACVEKASLKCNARITTDVAFYVTKNDKNVHPNHSGSAAKVEAVNAKAGMKRRALETMDPTSAVVEQLRQSTSIAAIAHLPTVELVARETCQFRMEQLEAPANPTALVDLVIPAMYSTYERRDPYGPGFVDEAFLRYDSHIKWADETGQVDPTVGEWCIYFASDRGLELLSTAKEIYADGTFSITPGLFSQFYTVHVRYQEGKHTIPCLFAFMANRTKETYISMFSHLKSICPRMNPRMVMTDFEAAAMNALQAVWPNIENKGCYFHLAQNQRKKIVDERLQELVDANPEIDMQVRMLRAMAFVPVDDIVNVWGKLMTMLDARLDPLVDYFDTYYVGRLMVRGQRRQPRFPSHLWNMYERTRNSQPQTNNSVEAYH